MGATGEIVVWFCCRNVRFWGWEDESVAFSQEAEVKGLVRHFYRPFRTQNHAARAVCLFKREGSGFIYRAARFRLNPKFRIQRSMRAWLQESGL